jgi:integrase
MMSREEEIEVVDLEPVETGTEVGAAHRVDVDTQRAFSDADEAATQEMEKKAKASATHKAYERQWAAFVGWCDENGRRPLPADADTIRHWLNGLAKAEMSPSTIEQAVSAVIGKHRENGIRVDRKADKLTDLILSAKRDARDRRKNKKPRKVAPVRLTDIIAVLTMSARARERGQQRLIDIRDDAILALGFAGALRRSEIVSLDLHEVDRKSDARGTLVQIDDGFDVVLHKSKSSQDDDVTIPLPCKDAPIVCEAIENWIEAAGIQSGEPVFQSIRKGATETTGERLSDKAVARIIKSRMAKRLTALHMADGMDKGEATDLAVTQATEYSGHSLRRGCITDLATAGQATHSIQMHSRHKSATMVAGYVDEATQRTNSVLGELNWGGK